MRIVPRVLEAKPTEEYRIWVRFEDGMAAEVDFREMVSLPGYYTDPLRDLAYFRKVDIYPGGAGIFWPNECDVCPDTLYWRAQQAAARIAAASRS